MTALLAWSTLPPVERVARLRALAAIARLYLGRGADPLIEALRRSERDPAHLVGAAVALEAVPTRTKRSILASFAESSLPPVPRVAP